MTRAMVLGSVAYGVRRSIRGWWLTTNAFLWGAAVRLSKQGLWWYSWPNPSRASYITGQVIYGVFGITTQLSLPGRPI